MMYVAITIVICICVYAVVYTVCYFSHKGNENNESNRFFKIINRIYTNNSEIIEQINALNNTVQQLCAEISKFTDVYNGRLTDVTEIVNKTYKRVKHIETTIRGIDNPNIEKDE